LCFFRFYHLLFVSTEDETKTKEKER